jgi:hypothetical protein
VAERNASQARFGRSFARDRHYGMPAAECCFVRRLLHKCGSVRGG